MISRANVKTAMSKILRTTEPRLVEEAILTDLVNDSFALIDMVIELQHEFDVVLVQDDLKNVKTVGDLLALVEERGGQLLESANG